MGLKIIVIVMSMYDKIFAIQESFSSDSTNMIQLLVEETLVTVWISFFFFFVGVKKVQL